jgi:glutaredoxin 3
MKFEVYGSTLCAWCDRAKELLTSKGESVEYIDVSTSEAAQNMFRENKLRTVPQIYHNGVHIGGYDKLVKYLEGE